MLRVSLLSWNTQGEDSGALSHELASFLQPILNNVRGDAALLPADIIVIGLQELPAWPSSSLSSFVLESDVLSKRCSAILAGVFPALIAAKFGHIKHAEFGFKSVDVFVKNNLLHEITACQIRALGQGLARVFCNKGALSVRLWIRGESLCFVNCHLQAHRGDVYRRRRRAQMKEIIRELADGHDHVLWFGDFNARLNLEIVASDALAMIRARDWQTLLQFDDHTSSISGGGFSEAAIEFAPTYKFRFEDSSNDGRRRPVYNLKRVPAYCDRVLYRGVGGHCREYTSLQQSISDHMPIHAVYDLVPPARTPHSTTSPRDRARFATTWKPRSITAAIVDMLFRMPLPCQTLLVLVICGIAVLILSNIHIAPSAGSSS